MRIDESPLTLFPGPNDVDLNSKPELRETRLDSATDANASNALITQNGQLMIEWPDDSDDGLDQIPMHTSDADDYRFFDIEDWRASQFDQVPESYDVHEEHPFLQEHVDLAEPIGEDALRAHHERLQADMYRDALFLQEHDPFRGNHTTIEMPLSSIAQISQPPQKKRRKTGHRQSLPNHDHRTGNMMQQNLMDDVKTGEKLRDMPGYQQTKTRKHALNQIRETVSSDEKNSTMVQDIRAFEKACRLFGRSQVQTLQGNKWLVKGMKSALLPHQILGTGFMIKRECLAEPEGRGGILADEMGLGKTVMTLALIVNRQKKGDIAGPTLIVAPAAVVQQWESEIDKHCEKLSETKGKRGVGDCLIFKYSQVRNLAKPISYLRTYNILLASYDEVRASYPQPPDRYPGEDEGEYMIRCAIHFEQKKLLLHRIRFHRVVLDEAQSIRNPETQTYKAVKSLIADHHWCLSGTIFVNGPFDIWAPLSFVGIKIGMSYSKFEEKYRKPSNAKSEMEFHQIVSGSLLRRTHATKLFDSRLITLPKTSYNETMLEFNELEEEMYEVVQRRFARHCSDMKSVDDDDDDDDSEEDESRLKRPSKPNPLALFTRLRQFTAHPLVISAVLQELLEVDDLVQLKDLASKYRTKLDKAGKAALLRITSALADQIEFRRLKNMQQIDMSQAASDPPTGSVDGNTGKKYGTRTKFAKFFERLEEKKSEANAPMVCAVCNKIPKKTKVTDCNHFYCEACLRDLMEEAAESGQDRARCESCGHAFKQAVFHEPKPSKEGGKKGLKKCKPKADAFDVDLETAFGADPIYLPSTKTLAVKGHILQFLKEDPSGKIIVFSQWLMMLRILENMCIMERWPCLLYYGGMTATARTEAIETFKTNPTLRIMLCSFKAGGVGLNLTMARYVISIDPWFNNALEDQAFARCYRIGQTKPTTMVSLCVKDSIDDYLQKLKSRKQDRIDAVDKGAPTTKETKKIMVEGLRGDQGTSGRRRRYTEQPPMSDGPTDHASDAAAGAADNEVNSDDEDRGPEGWETIDAADGIATNGAAEDKEKMGAARTTVKEGAAEG